MALADALFTPSILITLAICLILVSALGLFFIQKLNQQNHKINTMFDLVNTLAQEISVLKSRTPIMMSGGEQNMYSTAYKQEAPMNDAEDVENDPNNIHTIQMINVSDDGESDGDDESDGQSDGESDGDGESDTNDADYESGDDGDDSDDSESESESHEENAGKPTLHLEEMSEVNPDLLEVNSSIDIGILHTAITDELEDSESEENAHQVKNLDIVLDYKKASLIKLREIVVNKGLVSDSSKMKKSELLKLLEVE